MVQKLAFLLANCQSGGTEWFALRLAKALSSEGFEPLFAAGQAEGALLEEFQKHGKVFSLGSGAYSFWGILQALPGLVCFLKKQSPDIVISGLPLWNIALALAASFPGARPKRLIMVEHMRLCPRGLPPKRIKDRIKIAVLRKAYAAADNVIAVSQTALADLRLCSGAEESKMKLIYNPVVPDDFEALALTPPEHPWLKDKAVPVLVAVGRLLPIKDYPTLFHAFEKARETRPLRLIVYGEGYERPRLEALLRERGLDQDVSLPGATQNIFSALSHADLFVLSSRSEAFGNVVAEALACGAKIVATDCGGPREILENGRWGKLVPCENPKALAEEILKTLDEPNDPKARKERGLFFSTAHAAKVYLTLIGKL